MTVGPGFPTETSKANTVPFLRCVELYYFAEGSFHIFRPLRQYLGGCRLQDSYAELALREWQSRFVLRMNFWTRTVPHSFHGILSKTMILQWNTRAMLNAVMTFYLVPVTYELGP